MEAGADSLRKVSVCLFEAASASEESDASMECQAIMYTQYFNKFAIICEV